MSRVSTGNRMIPDPQINEATNEDHHPTTTVVYSNAAESLKKLKDKLAKAQMPKGLESENPFRHAARDMQRVCFCVKLHASMATVYFYVTYVHNLSTDLAASRFVSTAAEENVHYPRHDCEY